MSPHFAIHLTTGLVATNSALDHVAKFVMMTMLICLCLWAGNPCPLVPWSDLDNGANVVELAVVMAASWISVGSMHRLSHVLLRYVA